jgi:hypothetical protein
VHKGEASMPNHEPQLARPCCPCTLSWHRQLGALRDRALLSYRVSSIQGQELTGPHDVRAKSWGFFDGGEQRQGPDLERNLISYVSTALSPGARALADISVRSGIRPPRSSHFSLLPFGGSCCDQKPGIATQTGTPFPPLLFLFYFFSFCYF